MKTLAGLIFLSLGMVGCAVESAPDITDDTAALTSSLDEIVADEVPGWTELGATTQSCSQGFFSCQATCPFNGQRNVIVQICDGVEVVVREFPCTPEGCF